MDGRHRDLDRRCVRVLAVLAVIESTLDVVERRRNQQASTRRRRVQAAEPRQGIQCQVQLGSKAVGAQMADPPHETGVQMFRPEQLEQRRLRIGVRDHRPRVDALAGFEQDAARRVVGDQHPAYRRCGANRDSGSDGGFRQRSADRTHATERLRSRSLAGARLRCQTVQQSQHRAR